MISAVDGVLEGKGASWAFVRVGGITLQVHIPNSSLSTLGSVGQKVHLYTHLQVREDDLSLYGFASMEELSLFQHLISISGIGPKLALSLLSALSPNQLAAAIVSGDSELLRRVPGIGQKTASRLILELKSKLERVGLAVPTVVEGEGEVLSALTNLGYSLSEATRALNSLPSDQSLSLEEKIKLALQSLAGR
ncbi:MAG: Holliday junction branch migration protein RuvA [Chloroflexota bacterium]